MNNSSYIILSDKRKLSFSEYGDKNGFPVFYFHGSPSSFIEPLLIGNEVFRDLGLRIIAPNRPGIGESDFQSGRQFRDWPADVCKLADELGIEKFSLLAP